MEEILFTKMHGIGNDYIYINCLASTPRDIEQLAIEMSRPHTGIGSDGIILICPSLTADFKMRIFNADGSEAKMCGNGSRCVAKYVYDYGLTDSTTVTLETLSGIRTIHLILNDSGEAVGADVDMGVPEFCSQKEPVIAESEEFVDTPVESSAGALRLTAVSMGNPHGVVVVDNVADVALDKIGPELETHPMWPERANIEFISVDGPQELSMRVWERGSGETMACGTGACASVATAVRLGLVNPPVTVHLLGGDLVIDFNSKGNIIMSGPAATVFEGRYRRKS